MKTIVAASLLVSLSGIAAIYFLAVDQEPTVLEIGDINSDMVGTSVSTHGYISKKTLHENGHMFLTVSEDGLDIDVPVFSNVMQGMDHRMFRKGSRVKVTGTVDEYRNNIQVVPRKQEDILLEN